MSAMDEAVAAEAASVEAQRPPYPLLWEIQKQQMRGELREYLLRRRSTDVLSSEGLHFELSFGIPNRDAELMDLLNRPEPIALTTSVGQIHIRGKIDRVDRIRLQGREGLLVVDYKTGRLPSARDIAEGRNLQLPLYTEAAGIILGEEPLGGVFHRVGPTERTAELFWGGIKKRGNKYILREDFDSQKQAILAKIGEFIAAMQSGRFDLLPARGCASYCPFRQICHHTPARGELKSPPEQEQDR
jgi:hypothetical protein